MNKILAIILLALLWQSCEQEKEISSIDRVNWENRMISHQLSDSLVKGSTYLSVYSEIYSQTEHITHNLTATVSMRNTNRLDTVYIERADYFDTKGKAIRNYFDRTIYIAPMETVEIVIDEIDQEGGSGANFFFDWKMKNRSSEPLFEGVMISTSGQQGLSFTTQGKRVD